MNEESKSVTSDACRYKAPPSSATVSVNVAPVMVQLESVISIPVSESVELEIVRFRK